jgi:uncharacterized membrane protein HdeD (DUF308 family)
MLLARNWWAFLLRGMLAVIFGAVAVFFPTTAFLSLVIVFGAFSLIDGIFAIVAGFMGGVRSENWWWLILEGLFGIGIGILTLLQPAAIGLAWILVIAAWAIVTGVLEIITAIRLRNMITGEWALIVSGVLSVLFGIVAAAYPASGAFAIGWLIGVYALLFGFTLIALSLRLRKHHTKTAAA